MLADRKLERFLHSPAKDEVAFRGALIGKNTLLARMIVAKEFEQRFGKKGEVNQATIQALKPRGRLVSWVQLDIIISNLCKKFYRRIQFLENKSNALEESVADMIVVEYQKVIFFDNVRYILRSLPKAKDYKMSGRTIDYSTSEDKSRNFKTCFLCWRSVAMNKKKKTIATCYEHDIPSTSKEYRRRMNMRKLMLQILTELENSIPTPGFIRQQGMQHPGNFYVMELKGGSSFFPYVARYLNKVYPLWESAEDIVRCLEQSSRFRSLSDFDKKAWEFHFQDYGAYFELYYEQLLLAEAWLKAEAEYKHGGKR